MKRLLYTCIGVGILASAMAMSASVKVFETKYGVKPASNLGKAKCGVCHAGAKGGKALNSYGKDLAAAMKAANTKKLTADILAKVEGLDSNKNGKKNVDEIKADVNPGK
ncbi:MAG: hypothetical protein JST40_03935 [Armatimonadetes bacterium]|nr:hypothetical protein [Armatimonadota bacterium]